jgi:hypothetical protein
VCFFAAAVLSHTSDGGSSRRFLWSAGLLSLVLSLDDLFQFHEDLAPRYLGIDDKLVVGAYGAGLLVFLFASREQILRSEFPLLATALFFFAASNGVDLLQDSWPSPWRIFFEDGFKLLGIAAWTGYFTHTALDRVRATMR